MPTIRHAYLLLASLILAFGPTHGLAQPIETQAPNAILVDYDSGTVLLEKAADDPIVPASMAKLMTIEYVFHELQAGRLSMDQTFTVSEHAWRTGGAPSGGAAMYAALNSSVPLSALLRGVVVQSGNDAAIVIAEGVAGSEAAFVERLNQRAAELGMRNSHFVNASGLSAPDQLVTARDMATLAARIIRDYPEYYPMFSEPSFAWNKINQSNRNPLVGDFAGADGLKTGYIKESGYSMTASAVRDGQRLILVIAGLASESVRETEAKKLLEWGFSSFEERTAFEADETIAEVSVYGGERGRVPVKAKGPVRVLVARSAAEPLKARVVYQGPVMAPVESGKEVGSLKVWSGDRLIQETPLYTAASVGVGPLHARALDALEELLLGWIH